MEFIKENWDRRNDQSIAKRMSEKQKKAIKLAFKIDKTELRVAPPGHSMSQTTVTQDQNNGEVIETTAPTIGPDISKKDMGWSE